MPGSGPNSEDMARQRHWKNYAQGGEAVFVTTTVLDFVHAFQASEARDEMVRVILERCRSTRTGLTAFVVMPHHIHILIKLPAKLPVTEFAKRLKMAAAHRIRPLLPPSTEKLFDAQRGLNRRTFWQRSFRSAAVRDERMFWDIAEYIHENPVKAGYVASSADYRWSSARFLERGLWSEDLGLDLEAVLGDFARREASLNT